MPSKTAAPPRACVEEEEEEEEEEDFRPTHSRAHKNRLVDPLGIMSAPCASVEDVRRLLEVNHRHWPLNVPPCSYAGTGRP